MADQPSLLPLSADARSTLLAIARLAPGSVLRQSPICAEHPAGQRDVRGWVLDTPDAAAASALPLSTSMFDGVSVVRCDCTEAEVLALLSNESDTRHRLGLAVRSLSSPGVSIDSGHGELRASWRRRCQPTANGHPPSLRAAVAARDRSISFFQPQESVPVIDSEPWHPELSKEGFVGLYHHWHQGASTRQRRLCLYVACQSYLPKACLEYADAVRTVGDECSAQHVCLAHETDWLRKACSRNRARIIAHVCTAMGIPFPCMQDYNAAAPAPRMAICTTETLHHDMVSTPAGVRVLNYCAETARSFNGSVCAMAPWDGLWILHGAGAGADAESGREFGSAFGMHFLPTAAPRVAPSRPAAKGSPLSFVTADPAQCRAMQVWGAEAKQVAVRMLPECALSHALSLGGVCTDGLPDDVAEAYRKSLARQANPDTLLILPNIPGACGAGAEQHSYLVFDEAVLQCMASRGWCRAHGYSALIPLACAMPS